MMAASPRMRNALTLFSSTDCVLCHRVRLVLAAKGVTYDLVPVDPQNPPEDLVDLNPYHSVPTLVERDLVLYAASVVSEYLDERYPHPPLMPVDPLSRARLRLAMLRLEHDWVPQVQAIQLGNKVQAEAGRKRLKELLTASVPLFKASKFFLNPEMSLADCAMAPIIWRLPCAGRAAAEGRQGDRGLRQPHLPQSGLHPQPDRSGTQAARRCRREADGRGCSQQAMRPWEIARPFLCAFRVNATWAALHCRHERRQYTMTSHRPYLLRALYEWIADNGMTPHLLVDATRPPCRCRRMR